MNTETVQIFLTVAEYGSFSRSAEALFLSKQAIMQQINSLEDELGFALMARSRQGVTLTDAGIVFARGARQWMADQRRLVAEAGSAAGIERRIRLSSIDYHVVLDPVTLLYRQCYPDVRIEKIQHPSTLEARLVMEDVIDLGETLYNPRYLQPGFLYRPILQLEYVCVFGRDPLKSVIVPDDLAGIPVAAHDREFLEYYHIHLDRLRALIPQLEILSLPGRRIDVIAQALADGKVVLTASTFAKQVAGFYARPLAIDLFQECGVLFRESASSDVRRYADLAVAYYRRREGDRGRRD